MKRLKVILLLLLFVHSKMGMALNFHYCGDHIAAISSAYNPKGCGMEMTKNQKTGGFYFTHKSCCFDALKIFQSTEDISIADEAKWLDVDFSSPPILGIRRLSGLTYNQKIQINERPPPLQRQLFSMYGSFVFYE